MKLTDKKVAKALGWKPCNRGCRNCGFWQAPATDGRELDKLPKWTTSLDAIAGEIEARGPNCIKYCGRYVTGTYQWEGVLKAECWCEALLKFLE